MDIQNKILAEGKKLKLKYGYSHDPEVVRNHDGSLNYEDDKMDCSEFILYATKNASPELYSKLIVMLPSGKEGGNTKTIQDGIKLILGTPDLSGLKQNSAEPGEWVLWHEHIEMIENVTPEGRYLTLGANGADNGQVPKNIDCRNFESVKKIAPDFLGVWSPVLMAAERENIAE